MDAAIAPHPDGTLLRLDVSPGAKATRVLGFDPWRGRIKVAVQAPPVEGAANQALLAAVVEWTGVRQVRLLRGATSSRKDVVVAAPVDVVRAAWEALL